MDRRHFLTSSAASAAASTTLAGLSTGCSLYTSDAAYEERGVDVCRHRNINKKTKEK